jgi:hypothetical protein
MRFARFARFNEDRVAAQTNGYFMAISHTTPRQNQCEVQSLLAAVLMALAGVNAAHAISQPIQTQHGVVRLGGKTQANVDANHSSVAIGQGMILASSNLGGLG